MNSSIYNPTQSLAWLEKYFKTNYYKKPYDRFMWWRSYTPKSRPLSFRHPFRDRILNGDFDMAPYCFEAQIVEHRLNEKWNDWGRKDPGRFAEECAVDKARRKRLLEDFDKEETKRLSDLKKGFIDNIKMSKEQYDKEVINTRKTVIEFYYAMIDKYGSRNIRPTPVPEFR